MFRLHDKPQPTAKRLRRSAGGVSFIEALIVVIVLGFIGALVLPQFSDAAHASRQNTLKDDLRYLRTQIAVFRAQHRNLPPRPSRWQPLGRAKRRELPSADDQHDRR